MRNTFIYIVLGFLFLNVFEAFAQDDRKYIRHGNRDYKRAFIDSVTADTARFTMAEQDYREALNTNPNNWSAGYNLANSLYRQANYEEAKKQYQAVSGMETENKEELAFAYHNLGNSLLMSNDLEGAIEAYKDALRNNPSDLETKYNLAWAQDKLKQQEQEQQQDQQQDQNQNQDQDQEQDQKNDQQSDQDKKENQDKQQQQQQQENQNQQQQQQQQSQQISKEDAMRILQALQNDEKEVQKKVQKQKAKATKRKSEKDW